MPFTHTPASHPSFPLYPSLSTLPSHVDIGSDIRIERVYRECYPDVGVAYIGSSFVLECVPPAGSPMVNVTWYRNGNKIRQRDDPTIDFSNSRRLLEINPVSTNATGAYHCEAANTINENDPLQTEDIHLTPQCELGCHTVPVSPDTAV